MHPKARRKLNLMKKERRERRRAKKELLEGMKAGAHADLSGAASHAFPWLRATLNVFALNIQKIYYALFGV